MCIYTVTNLKEEMNFKVTRNASLKPVKLLGACRATRADRFWHRDAASDPGRAAAANRDHSVTDSGPPLSDSAGSAVPPTRIP